MSQPQQLKTIFVFTGPKGSGKSLLGSLFQQHCNVFFVRVEDEIKKQNIQKDRAVNDDSYIQEVFRFIEQLVRQSLQDHDQVAFESLGLTDACDQMMASLRQDFQVVTIRVVADMETCLDRIKTRDQSIHINISDDHVKMINEKVAEKAMDCDFCIENNSNDKTEKDLVADLINIMSSLNQPKGDD